MVWSIIVQGRASCHPPSSSTSLADVAHRRRCPRSTSDAHPATRVCVTRPTHPASRDHRRHARRWQRRRGRQTSRPDRGALARGPTGQGGTLAGRKRPRSKQRRDPGPTRQRREAPRGRNGPLGLGSTRPLDRPALHAAGQRFVLHSPRPNPRTPVGARRRTHPTSRGRRPGRSEAALRAAPTAPRARCGDVARGGPSACDPAPAGTRGPRHHLRLSPRDRQHRDRPHRPRTPSPDGPSLKLGSPAPQATRGRPLPII